MNKLLAGLITAIIFLAYHSKAALPDIITDPATRDAIEYLDAKVSRINEAIEKIVNGGNSGRALCITENKAIGYCTTQPSVTGACTCVAP